LFSPFLPVFSFPYVVVFGFAGVASIHLLRKKADLLYLAGSPPAVVLFIIPMTVHLAVLSAGIAPRSFEPIVWYLEEIHTLAMVFGMYGAVVAIYCVYAATRRVKRSGETFFGWHAKLDTKRETLVLVSVGTIALLPTVLHWTTGEVILPTNVASWVAWALGFPGLLVGGLVYWIGRQTRFRAYDRGVVTTWSKFAFMPWWWFRGYTVTENHVTLNRRYQMNIRMDRESIDDIDAVVGTLEDHLDRLE
jgi:hypothetical protein